METTRKLGKWAVWHHTQSEFVWIKLGWNYKPFLFASGISQVLISNDLKKGTETASSCINTLE